MSAGKQYSFLKNHAESLRDIKAIEHIEAVRRGLMRGEGPDPAHVSESDERIELHVCGLRLRLAPDLAPSSIDTLQEIFRDFAHRKLPSFRGKAAEAVVDLGANEGFYALAVQQENPECRIVAVEPNPRVFELLRTNCSINETRIETVRTAVTDTESEVRLQTYPHISTMSSRDIWGLQQNWMSKDSLGEIWVPSTTLRSLMIRYDVGEIDILKIDVEGDEAVLLEAAADSLTPLSNSPLSRIDRIVVEWHSSALRDRCTAVLESKGFVLVHEEPHRFGDLYFTRGGEADV